MGSSKDKKGLSRKGVESWLGRTALLGVARVVGAMPESAALRLGAGLGSLGYAVSKRYRTVAIVNLTQVFGAEWDQQRIAETAKRAFQNVGMNLVEFLRFRQMDPSHLDEIVTVEGEENAREALSRGRGIVAVTAHYGNFEMFGAAFARKGYPLSVIARDADDQETTELVNSLREKMGYQVFPRKNAARKALAVLRKNGVLGVLPDQNDTDGIFVPFFGRLAATATGPAFMALHTGAAVLPAFIHRAPNNKHVVRIFPPIEFTRTGDDEADIRALTTRINASLELVIRDHPEQWFWLHNRWKTRPPAELEGACRDTGQ